MSSGKHARSVEGPSSAFLPAVTTAVENLVAEGLERPYRADGLGRQW